MLCTIYSCKDSRVLCFVLRAWLLLLEKLLLLRLFGGKRLRLLWLLAETGINCVLRAGRPRQLEHGPLTCVVFVLVELVQRSATPVTSELVD